MKKILIILALLLFPQLAQAQSNPRNPCYYLTPNNVNCQPVTPLTPLPIGLGGFNTSIPINISSAATSQLVALSANAKIYVTSFDVIAGGTGNFTFVYGTGTNCGTGTTSLTGAYPLVAQTGLAKGNGVGAILIVPLGNALCVTNSAAVQMSGSLTYQQF